MFITESATGVRRVLTTLALLLALPTAALADGKLLATGAATQLEGSTGGGIVPWAIIAGNGTAGETGGSVSFTHVKLPDYKFWSVGGAIGFSDRFELSAARQRFSLGTLGQALGIPGARLRQDVFGAKLRLAGDLIYTDWPQLALGVQYKRLLDFDVPKSVGAIDDSGVDVYLSATKLWLGGLAGYNLLTGATLRATRANQIGLLGFGGDRNDDYELMAEGSVTVFFNRYSAFGVEYRQKPDNLGFAEEDDWYDAFLAYFPNKTISFVLAYADLGSVATLADQDGLYFSVKASF